jgi:hypothetical protein
MQQTGLPTLEENVTFTLEVQVNQFTVLAVKEDKIYSWTG